MRKALLVSTMFVALSAAAAAAAAAVAQEVKVRWHRTAPESEGFTVLMPEPPVRVRRVIPFSEELMLMPPVYEVAYRGVLFSVLSFEKKAAGAAHRSSDDFINGLRHAVGHRSRGADSKFTFEQEVTVNDLSGRQYLLRAEGREGSAQVYETATHRYVLMTLGAKASELIASNFFNSFTLDAKRARAVTDEVSVNRDFSTSPRAPEPLWPVAGPKSEAGQVIGPVGPIGPAHQGGSVRADNPPAPPAVGTPETPAQNVLSGGVLNGKATGKPQPAYPGMAVAARAQGVVVVQVTVDEEGYVISARAVSGHPLLQQAAVNAARQARFAPTRLDGKPVKVRGVITYNFVLEDDPAEPPTRKY